jgi:hypothetical protein
MTSPSPRIVNHGPGKGILSRLSLVLNLQGNPTIGDQSRTQSEGSIMNATTLVNRPSSRRPLIGAVLVLVAGGLLAFSAAMKFAGVPGVVCQMAADGFAGNKLLFIATLEILSTSLFLWPRTRSIGLLLVSSYLGGAICTHVQLAEFPKAIPPAVILSLAWIGTTLRHPQVLWSFAPDASKPNPLVARQSAFASGHFG